MVSFFPLTLWQLHFHTAILYQCKASGLKVAVASSADRIKVDANLAAAGLPVSMYVTTTLTNPESILHRSNKMVHIVFICAREDVRELRDPPAPSFLAFSYP